MSPVGDRFAVACGDGATRVFAFSTGKRVATIARSPAALEAEAKSGGSAIGGGGSCDSTAPRSDTRAGALPVALDAADLAARVALETDYLAQLNGAYAALHAATPAASAPAPAPPASGAGGSGGRAPIVYRPPVSVPAWDESGHFLCLPSPLGVELHNVTTGRTVDVLGHVEAGERFAAAALFQGVPKVRRRPLVAG
jgi:hypothetical protein